MGSKIISKCSVFQIFLLVLLSLISGIFAKNCLKPSTNLVPSCEIREHFKHNSLALNGSSYDCLDWDNSIFIKKDADITLDCTFSQPIDVEFDGVLPFPHLNLQFYKKYPEQPAGTNTGLDKLELIYGVRIRILQANHWSTQYMFHAIGDTTNMVTISIFNEKPHIPLFLPLRHLNNLEAYVDPTGKTLVIPCRAQNYNANVTLYYDYGPSELSSDVLKYDPRKGFLITIDEEEGIAYGLYECLTVWNGIDDRIKVDAIDPAAEPEQTAVAAVHGIITYEYEPFRKDVRSKCRISPDQGQLADYAFANVKTPNPTSARLNKKCLEASETWCELEQGDHSSLGKQHGNLSASGNSLVIETIYQAGMLKCSDPTHSEVAEYFVGTDDKIYHDWSEASAKEVLVKIEPTEAYERYTIHDLFKFRCKFPTYLGVKPIWWAIKFQNGTLYEEFDDHVEKTFDLELDMIEIQCGFTLWNSTVWNKASHPIAVTDFSLPIIKDKNTVLHFAMDSVNQALLCEVAPHPRSTIQWQRDGKKIEGLPELSYQNSLILFFESVNKTHEGTYTCVATSVSGDSKLDFQITVGDKPEEAAILPISKDPDPEHLSTAGAITNIGDLVIIPKVVPNATKPLSLHHMLDDKEIDPSSLIEPGELLVLRMSEENCVQNVGSISDNGCKVFVRVVSPDANGIGPVDPNAAAKPAISLYHMRDEKEIGPTYPIEPSEILVLQMPEENCIQNGGVISDNGCKVFVRVVNPDATGNDGSPLSVYHVHDEKEIGPTSSIQPGELLVLQMSEENCIRNGGVVSDKKCKVFVRVVNPDATEFDGSDPNSEDASGRLLLSGKSKLDYEDVNNIFMFPDPIDAKPMMVHILVPLVVGFGSILLVIIIAFVTYTYYVRPWKVRRISQVSTVRF